jgi:hypothetical protein
MATSLGFSRWRCRIGVTDAAVASATTVSKSPKFQIVMLPDPRAFSSEMGTGSREEKRVKTKHQSPF